MGYYNSALTIVILSFILNEISQISGRDFYSRARCDPDKLTVYKVHLKTDWSRELFPKQYPEWRPPAQWSKLIGRSHDKTYKLFSEGENSSKGLKQFAEQGGTDILDEESQGEGGIFDEFNAPPITEGVGTTEAEFFVDGNHSRVSLASRIVPSPDWFIGIDSFDLCVEGKWIESVVLEADPLDAGTDNGFTFTSPNWPSIPQKPVTRITAKTPDHPANSFYYPDRLEHPPISTFHIVKVKEYELSRSFSPSISRGTHKGYTVDTSSNYQAYEISNDVITNVIPMPTRSVNEVTTKQSSFKNSADEALLKSMVIDSYKKKIKKNRRGKKMGSRSKRRQRVPRDCRVSEWGPWSACSKTCDIGEQVRKRTVLKHARLGGRACPILTETQWCGSSRDCGHRYFDW